MANNHPIGIFDSGVGGLTVMRDIVEQLPQYDYLYVGDNARAPYGTRSFESIYRYTLECVEYLFGQGCPLIILACNTASAKALRTIQQRDLPRINPKNRVLGVIRPTAEIIGHHTKSGHIGVLGTPGTVSSESYVMEIVHQFPQLQIYQQPCPMWVPLIENGEFESPGADYFVEQNLEALLGQSNRIDTLLLACTHYPLLMPKIQAALGREMTILSQGPIVARSLANYLQRHPEIAQRCSQNGTRRFLTTDATEPFDAHANIFLGHDVQSQHIEL